MSKAFQIPVLSGGECNPVFPDRCVACGASKETESTLSLSRLRMRGERQEQLSLKLEIPHCRRCARATKSMFMAGCVPFVAGVLICGLGTFVAVTFGAEWWGLDEFLGSYEGSDESPSLLVGGVAGLVAAIAGGFLFELAARFLLFPLFGRALLSAPLLSKQFFDDSDYVAGLTGKLSADASLLQLTFLNDEVASEFASLNANALSTQREKR